MPNLGDNSKIGKNITSSSLKAIKALHVVAFGNEGETRKARKSPHDFSGFHLDKKSSENAQKVKQKVQLPDLIAGCNILDIDYSDDEEASEDEGSDEDENENDGGTMRTRFVQGMKMKDSFSLAFKDVEDSLTI
ncbi:hypothetical protein JTB14_004135 [Gonioctena quinquepunctata]|nr:hypothetical protein JTB14_004135 [Gonioctena quinquepunctata]